MKYWYDTEFIEDGTTIDLLSIGIVAEDGRELYLENGDADRSKASDWVKEHVLPSLSECRLDHDPHCDCPVRPKVIIGALLREFCDPAEHGKPEFWGYYSAYDHVVLCQLFGTMMDLPKDWPMYTRDLKQWCDELGNPRLPEQGKGEHHALSDACWSREAWQFLADYEYSLRHGSDRRLKKA